MPPRKNIKKAGGVKKQKKTVSPKDQIERKAIAIEKLDLETSQAVVHPAPPLRQLPNKTRPWAKWGKKTPLTDPAKLPKGWHMNEEDLETDDLDGQIERCHERIADNIMPDIFRQRLKQYTAAKAEQEKMLSAEPEGLGLKVVQRLRELEAMKTDLEENEDESNQLPNIIALLKAYRSGELDWQPGLVTYWSKGLQICEPRGFDWDELEAIGEAHRERGGFWTEGLGEPGPESSYMSLITSQQTRLIKVTLALRVPGTQWFAEMEFTHDTGCSVMSLYHSDLSTILGPYAADATKHPLRIGRNSSRGTTGTRYFRDTIELEVTLLDENRKRMSAWTRVPCAVNPGDWAPDGVPRLDGPVLREMLYTASAPDARRLAYFATSKEELFDGLPDVDIIANPPQAPEALWQGTRLAPENKIRAVKNIKSTGESGGPSRPKAMPKPAWGSTIFPKSSDPS